ncbi:MAG: Arabinose 5-phosphate isomerase KdsD [Chlamydiae bacterium]|nr:Arabinose 5-phosphate isomerase KdsD [Chlamydiota bacterium]
MSTTIDTTLGQLLDEQRHHIEYFYEELDRMQAEIFVTACAECEGLIILTGMGKSGIIAEKIALTLVSTGTRALFLPASNFLHGDIGIVGPSDAVVMLSKSGETDELLSLAPHIQKRGARLLALVSTPKSRLENLADLTLSLPVERELCPFDLAPTTSTAVQLLFGDLLTIALMQKKGFSLEQYGLNHPSGTIGKKTSLRVKDLMIQGDGIPLCNPEEKLIDQIVELSNKKCGCLLIVGENRELLGIFTDGDLRRALQSEGALVLEKKMETLMVTSPISTSPEMLAFDALKLMQRDPKRWVMMTPVVSEGQVKGIIRMHDIVHEGF